jgi:predicted nucleic acid-binding protein
MPRFVPGARLPDSVYLDTNFLLYVRDASSARYRSASTCFAELIRQRGELRFSSLVIDEFWWGLFRASYRVLVGT